MYHEATQCRACGYGAAGLSTLKQSTAAGNAYAQDGKLIPVFDLGIQPLANDFCAKGDKRKGWAPLEVLFCPSCSLAQLSVVVDPAVLYTNYPYVTSNSRTMLEHFKRIFEYLKPDIHLKNVLEIGSNDGRFLFWLEGMGAKSVFGVDPADNLVTVANKYGVKTYSGIWDTVAAEEALQALPGGANLIIARHVFCHVDDWQRFIHALMRCSHRGTMVYIEVPWAKDLLDAGEFDTIYHEHTSYFTLRAMKALLHMSGWELHRVERFPVHGGVLGIVLSREDANCPEDPSVQAFLDAENVTLERWREFSVEAQKKIATLSAMVRGYRTAGKRVVGYGASAKSTVWVNACGFTRKDLDFITDTTPQKMYKQSPGSGIPIVDEGALTRELPDYAILFAWNYAAEILEKEKIFREKGGKFIIPHPTVTVV